MSYIKYGIVTKIKLIKNKNKCYSYLKETLNLSLYDKYKNYYILSDSFINKNLKSFREEFLKLTNNYGDSLDNCEAYCLNTKIDNLIKTNIIFTSDNERYYFKGYESLTFNLDIIEYNKNGLKIKLFLLPIFWDIYKVTVEDFSNIENILNQLTQKTLKNPLKEASIFTVV